MPDTVSAKQLEAMLRDGAELALLDVREAGQFGEGHLFFAVSLPYSRLELEILRLVPRKATRVVLCDDGESGVARAAARRLHAAGYGDVRLLEEGTAGWSRAGHRLFRGVHVPSKAFGELVEQACRTPRLSARELARMQAAGEDVVVVDGRPFAEYRRMSIPGAVCCPNAELPYRIGEIVPGPATCIVVNCAGRTRSIIGAQTLIEFGVPNRVYALEDGTQGWFLAGLPLEHGAARRYPEDVDRRKMPELRARARALARRYGARYVTAAEVEGWLGEGGRTTYVLDVRTPEEFAAGSIPGAAHAPGGQLVQATDQWIAVRAARVVVFDSENVRAPVTASWLRRLGYAAYVLEDGAGCSLRLPAAASAPLPALRELAPTELAGALAAGACTVFDLGPSMRYRREHVPGARWSIRPRLAAAVRDAPEPVVLVAEEPDVARAAALDLAEAGVRERALLAGGLEAWRGAGLPLEASSGEPPDAECIDSLFFAHDRHTGNCRAAEEYLAWEKGLVAQLEPADRDKFRPLPAA